MASERPTLQRATPADHPYVVSLLRDNDLPAEDVPGALDTLYVAYDGDERVGVGGFERHGSAGLLRSLAVEESARDAGVGTALCTRLEATARERGIDALYLLTTTAAEFFLARGYTRIGRSDAPDPIRETREFEDLCPATAACLRRSL
ncbi:GNAT family N-acetyltransferase [Halovenus sp. WSH3]|uniref:GNAT family N-acetyltransferase n=1 Tax=Halovenus carboxidivorans TaxID=2692199 RepID=A0A6B0T9F9_9EURY|nr:arsenic resistance N-acetyltransferase ArsN2 [Halovenus carboxidivorans]MXR51992.1 GNAT family N-acetyltransferase [Halovenus carboxidivorans]